MAVLSISVMSTKEMATSSAMTSRRVSAKNRPATRTSAAIVKRLRAAPIANFKAKDIFRASGLSLLGVSNLHVEKDRGKILAGKRLSPVLLVRDA
jgi:hypothetical protein